MKGESSGQSKSLRPVARKEAEEGGQARGDVESGAPGLRKLVLESGGQLEDSEQERGALSFRGRGLG